MIRISTRLNVIPSTGSDSRRGPPEETALRETQRFRSRGSLGSPHQRYCQRQATRSRPFSLLVEGLSPSQRLFLLGMGVLQAGFDGRLDDRLDRPMYDESSRQDRSSTIRQSKTLVRFSMMAMTKSSTAEVLKTGANEPDGHPAKYIVVGDLRSEDCEDTCLRPLGLCELGGSCDSCWYRPDHPRFQNR